MVILEAEAKNEQRVIVPTAAHSITTPFTRQIGRDCVFMSGFASIGWYGVPLNDIPTTGSWDEKRWMVHLLVGPTWRDVRQACPTVTPAANYNWDADEDDEQGFMLDSGCDWDEVEGYGGKRIRLKFEMGQFGEDNRFYGVAYNVVATGFVTPHGW